MNRLSFRAWLTAFFPRKSQGRSRATVGVNLLDASTKLNCSTGKKSIYIEPQKTALSLVYS